MMTVWYVTMLVLLWSVFYRATITSRNTLLSVRIGLFAMSAAALVGMVAPLYGYSPHYITVIVVVCIVYAQAMFAGYWRTSVPGQYIKPECRTLRRREDFERMA